jgi:hypothetical protein
MTHTSDEESDRLCLGISRERERERDAPVMSDGEIDVEARMVGGVVRSADCRVRADLRQPQNGHAKKYTEQEGDEYY